MSKWRVSESWTTMRCTIMSNGWINGRSHIKLNFLVSCTYVTIIFKSLDVSSWMKDAQLMFHLLDEMVMGVQVEMLCRASLIMPLVVFLLVGSWRKNTQPYSRLHPLLRISKLEWVKKLVDHAKCITNTSTTTHGYWTWWGKNIGAKELTRPSIPIFATNFLLLQPLNSHA